ncbi:hypothetical protein BGZ51_007383 [Haplosporangium sp. Z 767]|nr:hypothetical protein BGZ51_007383 [Haplosporangium sp. Z 767]
MVQSFNLQGILQSFRVLASPRLMMPNLVVRDIRDINFEQLHKAGIVAIAFDKDNCLTRPYGHDLHPPFKDAWKRCRDVYKDQVVIVSNSAGTPDDKDDQLAKALESSLQVHVLRHKEKKPSGGQELLKHFDGIKAAKVAFVGDRALTDVVFGNNEGMLTILTRDVVTEEGDNPMAIRVGVISFDGEMNVKARPHPFPIDLRAVVLQPPPPPPTSSEPDTSSISTSTSSKTKPVSTMSSSVEPAVNTTSHEPQDHVVTSEPRQVSSSNNNSCTIPDQLEHRQQQQDEEEQGTHDEDEEPVHSIELIGHIKARLPGRH